uniref:3-beta hydroxysteroid dehydrogenase/isomerase domain-containing protein n=1 Tax=Seriola dumerili TaxID=41447 RepID=A0A3B4VJI0_SERDU
IRDSRGVVYLITGGCGFLGRHMLRVLLENEDKVEEVRVFDKHVDTSLSGLSKGKTSRRRLFVTTVLWCFRYISLY